MCLNFIFSLQRYDFFLTYAKKIAFSSDFFVVGRWSFDIRKKGTQRLPAARSQHKYIKTF